MRSRRSASYSGRRDVPAVRAVRARPAGSRTPRTSPATARSAALADTPAPPRRWWHPRSGSFAAICLALPPHHSRQNPPPRRRTTVRQDRLDDDSSRDCKHHDARRGRSDAAFDPRDREAPEHRSIVACPQRGQRVLDSIGRGRKWQQRRSTSTPRPRRMDERTASRACAARGVDERPCSTPGGFRHAGRTWRDRTLREFLW